LIFIFGKFEILIQAEEVQISPVQDFSFYPSENDFTDKEDDWESPSGVQNDVVDSTSNRLVKNALKSSFYGQSEEETPESKINIY